MGKGNRLRGLRANTITVDEQPSEQSITQMKDLGMKEFAVSNTRPNRIMRRLRLRMRLRYYSGPDDKTGKPLTAKGVKHRNGAIPFDPSKNSNETNHKRVVRQRLQRKLLQGVR